MYLIKNLNQIHLLCLLYLYLFIFKIEGSNTFYTVTNHNQLYDFNNNHNQSQIF